MTTPEDITKMILITQIQFELISFLDEDTPKYNFFSFKAEDGFYFSKGYERSPIPHDGSHPKEIEGGYDVKMMGTTLFLKGSSYICINASTREVKSNIPHQIVVNNQTHTMEIILQ